MLKMLLKISKRKERNFRHEFSNYFFTGLTGKAKWKVWKTFINCRQTSAVIVHIPMIMPVYYLNTEKLGNSLIYG
jgi:hypothetical protein